VKNRYETRKAKSKRGGYEVIDRQAGKVMDSCFSRTLCEETRKHLEAKHRDSQAAKAVVA